MSVTNSFKMLKTVKKKKDSLNDSIVIKLCTILMFGALKLVKLATLVFLPPITVGHTFTGRELAYLVKVLFHKTEGRGFDFR